jgi:hypothetical protein
MRDFRRPVSHLYSLRMGDVLLAARCKVRYRRWNAFASNVLGNSAPVADYIPELKKANPTHFGVSLATVDVALSGRFHLTTRLTTCAQTAFGRRNKSISMSRRVWLEIANQAHVLAQSVLGQNFVN